MACKRDDQELCLDASALAGPEEEELLERYSRFSTKRTGLRERCRCGETDRKMAAPIDSDGRRAGGGPGSVGAILGEAAARREVNVRLALTGVEDRETAAGLGCGCFGVGGIDGGGRIGSTLFAAVGVPRFHLRAGWSSVEGGASALAEPDTGGPDVDWGTGGSSGMGAN